MARVVVVGAGLAGLAVAVRLADLGHQVRVLEAGEQAGGAAAALLVDGTPADALPSTFTLPAALRELFRATGAPLEKVLDVTPVDPVVQLVPHPTGTAAGTGATGPVLSLPNARLGAMVEAIGTAEGADTAAAWQALLRTGDAAWQRLRTTHVTSATGGSVPRAGRPRWWPPSIQQPTRPLTRWVDLAADTTGPATSAHLVHQALEAGLDPRRVGALAAAIPYLSATFGVWEIDGGLPALVTALADRARALGVELRTGARVRDVRSTSGRVVGVQLSTGEAVPADVVVVACHPAGLRESGDPRPPTRALVRQPWTRGPALLTLVTRLPETVADAPRRAVLYPTDVPAALDDLLGPALGQSLNLPTRRTDDRTPQRLVRGRARAAAVGTPVEAPPRIDRTWVEVETIGRTVSAHATVPAHRAAEHGDPDPIDPTDRPAPPGVDWRDPSVVDATVAQLRASLTTLGLPPIGAEVVRTPADVADATGAPGGAVGWLAPRRTGTGWPLRPGVRTGPTGLFLVGASAHPGGSLPFVISGTRTVAEQIGRA